MSMPTPTDRAAAPVAMPWMSRMRAKTVRRPSRSASRPPTETPIIMPTKPIEPIQPSRLFDRPHWAARAVMTSL